MTMLFLLWEKFANFIGTVLILPRSLIVLVVYSPLLGVWFLISLLQPILILILFYFVEIIVLLISSVMFAGSPRMAKLFANKR